MRLLVLATFLVCLSQLAGGCFLLTQAQVGVLEVGTKKVQENLNANALTTDEPSTLAREALHAFDLEERFEEDPDAALAELHRAAALEPDRGLLYALAELSFLTGTLKQSPAHFLAAAVYAYCFLLGADPPEPPSPFDRRFRWACDLYNLGLQLALGSPDKKRVLLEGGRRSLPVGSIEITVDRSRFPWSEQSVSEFLPADRFLVRGLSLRHRDSGLGVPLIASPPAGPSADPAGRFLAHRLGTPATAFLRLAGGIRDIEAGIAGTLELYSGGDAPVALVQDRAVPLESDLTAPLAYMLHTEHEVWEFSLHGFFGDDPALVENRLLMIRPYQAGRVPVLFVHGTASSPAYWAEMLNTLQADPSLRETIQFWFFFYNTGNPIAYSAGKLRESLRDIFQALDPQGLDPALRRLVVIGHSQGGLLARLMATDGSTDWLEDMSGIPLDDFDFSSKQRELVTWALDFDPVPQVERLVFISTPHGGSFLAERRFARWISSMIALPGEVIDLGERVMKHEESLPPEMRLGRVATSLDNMDSRNPFLRRMQQAPIAPGVAVHSIVAVQGDGPVEEGDDGVVAYTSAHLEGVDSEFVVRDGHSCQSHPLVIREVRRILIEHVRDEPRP